MAWHLLVFALTGLLVVVVAWFLGAVILFWAYRSYARFEGADE